MKNSDNNVIRDAVAGILSFCGKYEVGADQKCKNSNCDSNLLNLASLVLLLGDLEKRLNFEDKNNVSVF